MINTTFTNNNLAKTEHCHNVDPNDDGLGGVIYISGYESDILIQNSTFESNQTQDRSHFIVLYQTESPRIANSWFSKKTEKHSSFINHLGFEDLKPLAMNFWNNTFIFENKILNTTKSKQRKLIASSQTVVVKFMETHYASSKFFSIVTFLMNFEIYFI